MNIKKTLKELIAAETKTEQPPEPAAEVDAPSVSVSEPTETKTVETTVPQEKIDAAMELAATLQEKINSLATELGLAIEDLNGQTSPSVLESQDDFKSLVLRLQTIKRKIMVV